jgi:hypothetical protein
MEAERCKAHGGSNMHPLYILIAHSATKYLEGREKTAAEK